MNPMKLVVGWVWRLVCLVVFFSAWYGFMQPQIRTLFQHAGKMILVDYK